MLHMHFACHYEAFKLWNYQPFLVLKSQTFGELVNDKDNSNDDNDIYIN